MKKKSISIIALVFFMLVVIGGAVGLAYKLTDGFAKKDTRQLVSTTIVSDKYGTFELPVSNLLLQNGFSHIVFVDGTDFNYIWETELEKAKELNSRVTDESELIFEYDYKFSIPENLIAGRAVANHNGPYYFVPDNKVVKYNFEGENEIFKDIYPLVLFNSMKIAVTLPNDNSVTEIIKTTFYCKNFKVNYQEQEYFIACVVISDKGCPLTDYIYDEMMADSTTQIVYNYAE